MENKQSAEQKIKKRREESSKEEIKYRQKSVQLKR